MYEKLKWELINIYGLSAAVAIDVVNSRNEEEMKTIKSFLDRCGHEINPDSE